MIKIRLSICKAMVYALDHSESAEGLVRELVKNINKEETPVYIIPRLYLISDILYNCAASSEVLNGWAIRTEFENVLPEIFEYLNHVYVSQTGRLTGANLTEAVDKVIKMWDEKAIYDNKFTNGLKASFSRPKEFTLAFIKSTNELLKNPDVAKNDPEKAYIFPKLADVEQYLQEEYKGNIEILEKKCRQNGISTQGTFDEIFTRMLSLEYQVLKDEYSALKKEEEESKEQREEQLREISGELEVQLIALRNRLMDIQRLYLEINAESIDGSPITAEDINLLDLPRDLLSDKKISEIEGNVEDEIDGVELTTEELEYLKGHENEIFITVEIPINSNNTISK